MPTTREQPEYPHLDYIEGINQNRNGSSYRPLGNSVNFNTSPYQTMSLSREFQTPEVLRGSTVEEVMALYDQLKHLSVDEQFRMMQRTGRQEDLANANLPGCPPDCINVCMFCGMLYHRCQSRHLQPLSCNSCYSLMSMARLGNSAMDLNSDPTGLAMPIASTSAPLSTVQQMALDRRPARSITNRKQSPGDGMNSLYERSMMARGNLSNNGHHHQNNQHHHQQHQQQHHDDGVQDIFSRVDHFNVASVEGSVPPKRKTSHKKLVINSKVRRIMVGHAKKFGQYGNNPGELSEPSGVATNSRGEILVVDSNNRRINIYNGAGEHLRSIEGQDPNSTSVMFANRIAICPVSGNIVITERPPTKVGKILSPSGHLLKKFGEGIIEHPRGLAVDARGRILVLQSMVGRVDIFSMEGDLIGSFQLAMDFPFSIATNRFEEIFVADNKKHVVKVYDYKGNHLRDIGGEGITNFPVGVNIGKNDEVVVCDNHNNFNITIFDREGSPIVGLKGEIKHTQCYGVTLTDNYEVILCSKDYEVCKYQIEPRHLDRTNRLLFFKGENDTDDDDFPPETNGGDQSHEGSSNVPSPYVPDNGDVLQARFREMNLSGRSSGLAAETLQRQFAAPASGLRSPALSGNPFLGPGVYAGALHQQRSEFQIPNGRGFGPGTYEPGAQAVDFGDDALMQFRAPGGPIVPMRQRAQNNFGPMVMPGRTSYSPIGRQSVNHQDLQMRFNNYRAPH